MVSHVVDQSRVSLAALVMLCGEVADEDVLYAATFWVSKGVVSRSGGSSSGEAGGQHPSEVFYSVQEDQAAHMAGMQDEGADNDADDDQVGINDLSGHCASLRVCCHFSLVSADSVDRGQSPEGFAGGDGTLRQE